MKECCNNAPNNRSNYLSKLQYKWKLTSIFQVIIVLIIFALGGSTCAFLGKKYIMPLFNFESRHMGYWLVYIIVVTILWPICVMFYSILFGQYAFFKSYLTKMGKRMIGKK
jgi:hypothetical protein